MKALTPPKIRVLRHMEQTEQRINLDASGKAFLADGTQVNQLTLRALLKRQLLAPCGTDLFGSRVAAYEIAQAEKAA